MLGRGSGLSGKAGVADYTRTPDDAAVTDAGMGHGFGAERAVAVWRGIEVK